MASRTTLGAIIALLTLPSMALIIGCGSKIDNGVVTETGNPPVVDETRITATPLKGAVRVEGADGSVPDGAEVEVINETSDESVVTTADEDGSFAIEVDGDSGDSITVRVKDGGQTTSISLKAGVDAVTPDVQPPPDVSELPPAGSEDVPSPPPAVPTTTIAPPGTPPPPPPPPDTTTTQPPAQLPVPENHRAEPTECDAERPAGNVEGSNYPIEGECETDADCDEGERGRCEDFRGYAQCTYDECTQDSECATGGPCGCELGFWSDSNVCLGGNCQVDGDCGEGGYCSPSFSECGSYSGVVAHWCHTPEDECVNDSECADADTGYGYCMYSSEVTHWVCSYSQCAG